MKSIKFFFNLFTVCSILVTANVHSQDNPNPEISKNIPLHNESETPNTDTRDLNYLSGLEEKHKQAIESGYVSETVKTESEINMNIRDNMQYNVENTGSEPVVMSKNVNGEEGDWTAISNLIHNYKVSKNQISGKQIDMKRGDDGYLYAAVNFPEANDSIFHFKNGVAFYKSSDDGISWDYISTMYFVSYVESISLLVESKNNSIQDSTRLVLFYSASWNSDYSSAYIGYGSFTCNGFYFNSGTIANPGSGNKFTGISAVSDGAYYQTATYFGVVCTESDNVTGVSENLRFFRTVNWGGLWAGSAIVTGFNEKYPSAEYKEGSSDSVYIAVERVLNAGESQIRIIATTWIPSSNKNVYYITSTGGVKYEKPCMTIRQTSPAQQILITCTKNKNALYHYTNNAATWYTDIPLSFSTAQSEEITFCSSANTGTKPFSAGWVSGSGDSLFMTKGDLGNMLGNHTPKINNVQVSKFVTPVCVTIPHSPEPNSGVIYSTYLINQDSVKNVYFNREGTKFIKISVIPQGLYNALTNKLNVRDTVRIYLRSWSNVNIIIDSGKAVIDSNTFLCSYNYSWLSDGGYYIQVKHRNSLETWSQFVICNGSELIYDFTNDDQKAYGGNQKQIDFSPEKYGIYAGDVNQDGAIDASDLSIADNDSYSALSGYTVSDITGDRFVDASDVAIIDNNASLSVNKVTP